MKPHVIIGALLGVLGLRSLTQGVPVTATLGRIRLAHGVLADGKPLPAGTYEVRLTGNLVKPAVGQTPNAERWVEFVKEGQIVGREVATVVSNSDIGAIRKGPRPPANQARVDVLKGDLYIRAWINRDGNNYLINLPTTGQETRPQ